MPRANRYHLPGHIWHLTHRCHRRQFLLRFARDRRAWLGWLREARRRYGLCVLDYAVTSNHVHLLLRDRGRGEIAPSMQLIAGRTAQAYNRRKRRRGAFWEDRYHATAVDSGEHLAHCVVYIDLNMVRAGAVSHPAEWESGGYREIQAPLRRHRIIDRPALADALGIELVALGDTHAGWIEEAIAQHRLTRESHWTESVAVGRPEFVERVRTELGARARYRAPAAVGTLHVLRDASPPYGRRFAAENTPGTASSP